MNSGVCGAAGNRGGRAESLSKNRDCGQNAKKDVRGTMSSGKEAEGKRNNEDGNNLRLSWRPCE